MLVFLHVPRKDWHLRKLDSEDYKFDFLFRVNKGFEQGWKMCVLGRVKQQYLYYLSEQERKAQAKTWWLEPNPRVYQWPADEYIMITEIIDADPIPYNLNVGFFNPKLNITAMVDLGWVDLAQPAAATSTDPNRPESCYLP